MSSKGSRREPRSESLSIAPTVVDVVVPTIAGREASLERCLKSYAELTDAEVNPIVVRDSETCGAGWREGLAQVTAEFVLLACDDQEAAIFGWAETAIAAAREGFVACPRVWTPDSSLESCGGEMGELHHLARRHRRHGTQVDYATIPFLTSELAEEVGMIDVHYASDVWVSYRARQLGHESVLVHGFEVIHHQEQLGRGAGMDQGERDAMDVNTLRKELEEAKA